MKVLVLGSGAGGGFPQWNCNCRLCGGLRRGEVVAKVRTQSSIAISADGRDWVLLNASPDVAQQIRSNPVLQPCSHAESPLRHTPIRAVVLMDAHIDHVAGLLSLREGPSLPLYATSCVMDDLTTGLPLLQVLQHYCGVRTHLIPVAGEQRQGSFQIDGFASLRVTAISIPGKAPPYSPHRGEPKTGDNIALHVEDLRTGGRLYYAPGLAEVGDDEIAWMSRSDCVMVDGTFWTADEMRAAGLGTKLAAEMGHLPQVACEDGRGMISSLDRIDARRKVLIHVNNSNPILDEHGAQRQTLARHGIEVAYDGMEIEL